MSPNTLPLPDYLVDLLQGRSSDTPSLYVFPGNGEHGHFIEPRKQIDKVKARSGIDFCPHDLRRTFITVAESLKLGVYTIKRLVNHKMTGDVTAGYVCSTTEELREAMQAITDCLLSIIHSNQPPKIIMLAQHRNARSK